MYDREKKGVVSRIFRQEGAHGFKGGAAMMAGKFPDLQFIFCHVEGAGGIEEDAAG